MLSDFALPCRVLAPSLGLAALYTLMPEPIPLVDDLLVLGLAGMNLAKTQFMEMNSLLYRITTIVQWLLIGLFVLVGGVVLIVILLIVGLFR